MQTFLWPAAGRARRALLVATGLAALSIAPQAAATPPNVPDQSWAPNGRVSAIARIGRTVYIGGSFTAVVENGGAGPGVLSRDHLAAFDAITGAPTEWAPSANDEVYALVASPDRDRIYVGGRFTSIDGSSRSRLAAISPFGAGELDSGWQPPTSSASVLAIAASSDKVYAGGFFTTVGGEDRSKLAAFSAEDGALDPDWDPSADAVVRTLALSEDETRVFAGGDFTTVSDAERRSAAAMAAEDGALIDSWRPDPGQSVFDLAPADSTVYAAVGGRGALEAGWGALAAWGADDGALHWLKTSSGDFHALAVAGDALYAGGHGYYFEGQRRGQLVGLDRGNGRLIAEWSPNVGGEAGGGVWALSTRGNSRLAAGGDFTTVGAGRQEHYAQWTGSIGTVPPPAPGSNTAGSTVLLDVTPPRVSGFRLVRTRRRPLRRAFRYRLSEPAAVRITIERVRNVRTGRRVRFRKVGVLRRAGRLGLNRVPFNGRIGSRKLRRGRYRATIVATDAAGNRSKPKRLRFKVRKRS